MSDIINESATQDRISVSTWVSVRRAVWLLVHILLSHQGCGKTTIPTSIYAAAAAAVSLEYLLGLPTAISYFHLILQHTVRDHQHLYFTGEKIRHREAPR